MYSTPGMGTVFNIFLPSTNQDGGDVLPGQKPGQKGTFAGTDLILVVDDDALVLRGVVRNLQHRGHAVLQATSAEEAKTLFAKARGKVTLLLTDIMMPLENGKSLADFLQAEDVTLKVLFMSGYQAGTIADHGIIQGHLDLIEKLFTGDEVARKVRDVLDRPADET